MTISHANNQGFTLLEVLIAMVISSMLLAALMQSYALLTQGWETRFDAFSETLSSTRKQHLVRRSIASMVPYNPPERETNTIARSGPGDGPLFVGRESRMQWVTTMPVFERDIALARLSLEEIEAGRMGWVYAEARQEKLADGASSTDWAATEARSFVIATSADGQKLQYYGFESLDRIIRSSPENRMRSQRNSDRAQWRAQYRGMETQLLPRRVRIIAERGDTQHEFSVHTNSIRHGETNL